MSLGWNKHKIYLLHIQTMGVPSRIIERIDESLAVVTYIEYLGGERMQLEECCVPRFIIANVRAGAFLWRLSCNLNLSALMALIGLIMLDTIRRCQPCASGV